VTSCLGDWAAVMTGCLGDRAAAMTRLPSRPGRRSDRRLDCRHDRAAPV